MEKYLEKYLLKQKLITLKELKMVEGDKKKVISSCIFIPESPKIYEKAFSYFTGVIKSIETFNTMMDKKWLYRLYVDDLFFRGLKKEGSKMRYAYNNVSSNSSSPELSK